MTVPLVTVHTTTYNHAPYIGQAIEGALQQKTNFPIEIVIGEDCSTDGTREIVFDYQAKYPDIIRVITSDKNVGSKENSRRVREASRGKYIALCEGDDYWTDPYKLQKQVTFLENNQDYAVVHSDADVLSQDSGKLYKSTNKWLSGAIPSGYIYEDLLVRNSIGTLTVLIRNSILLNTKKVHPRGIRQKLENGRLSFMVRDIQAPQNSLYG